MPMQMHLPEATALESLYKLGAAFSEPMRSQLDSVVLEYSQLVIEKEWPEMANNTFLGGKVGAHELWATVLADHPKDNREQMLMDKSIDQLNLISQARGRAL